jgi:hypothetical protein
LNKPALEVAAKGKLQAAIADATRIRLRVFMAL